MRRLPLFVRGMVVAALAALGLSFSGVSLADENPASTGFRLLIAMHEQHPEILMETQAQVVQACVKLSVNQRSDCMVNALLVRGSLLGFSMAAGDNARNENLPVPTPAYLTKIYTLAKTNPQNIRVLATPMKQDEVNHACYTHNADCVAPYVLDFAMRMGIYMYLNANSDGMFQTAKAELKASH